MATFTVKGLIQARPPVQTPRVTTKKRPMTIAEAYRANARAGRPPQSVAAAG